MSCLVEFVDGLGLRYFRGSEVAFLGESNTWLKSNNLPPESLWDAIVPTLKFADEVRACFGHPLRILSAFRNETYNRQVGGVSGSFHRKFMALDLAPVRGGSVAELAKIARKVRDERGGGGVGRYSWGVHIDTRKSIASW